MLVEVSLISVTLSRQDESVFRSRLLERWHLLSLDAPTVAAAWTWYVARRAGIALPARELLAMFMAVWVLYAADRLLDGRDRHPGRARELEARHHFHWLNRGLFRMGIAVASLALACLLTRLPEPELARYTILGTLLAGWFVVIHTGGRPLPKEFVVGLFFAAAVFVPAVVRRPALRSELLLPAALLAGLASVNGLFIFGWEHEGGPPGTGHASTRWAAGWVVWIGLLLAAVSSTTGNWAVAGGSALLLGLHTLRGRFARTTLRALADLAILLPVLGAVVR